MGPAPWVWLWKDSLRPCMGRFDFEEPGALPRTLPREAPVGLLRFSLSCLKLPDSRAGWAEAAGCCC